MYLADDGVSQCRPLLVSSGSPVEVFYQNRTRRNSVHRYSSEHVHICVTVCDLMIGAHRFHVRRHLIMFGFGSTNSPSPLYTENISFCLSELSIWTARSPSHCLPHNLLPLPLALRTPLPLARLTLEQEGR